MIVLHCCGLKFGSKAVQPKKLTILLMIFVSLYQLFVGYSGGQCESLFPCLVSMGIVAGSCGGLLSVCCVKPATVNRWLQDNRVADQINSAFNRQKERVRNDPKVCLRPILYILQNCAVYRLTYWHNINLP